MHFLTTLLVTYTGRSGFMFRFYWGGLALSMMHFRVSCKLVGSFSEPFLLGLWTVILFVREQLISSTQNFLWECGLFDKRNCWKGFISSAFNYWSKDEKTRLQTFRVRNIVNDHCLFEDTTFHLNASASPSPFSVSLAWQTFHCIYRLE